MPDATEGGASALAVHRSGTPTGDPVVFIHGFAGDSNTWYAVRPKLEATHPVYRIDLPNHGRSPISASASFEDLKADVLAAFDALDLRSAHLVGHSLGGACAIALAAARLHRVASLTLIAPGGLAPTIAGDIVEGLVTADTPETLAPFLRRVVADPSFISDDLAEVAMAARASPTLRAAQARMNAKLFPAGHVSFRVGSELETAAGTLPTRIVWGRDDQIASWETVFNVPGTVALNLIRDAGHAPHLEFPALVTRIIQEQVRSADRAASQRVGG